MKRRCSRMCLWPSYLFRRWRRDVGFEVSSLYWFFFVNVNRWEPWKCLLIKVYRNIVVSERNGLLLVVWDQSSGFFECIFSAGILFV